MSLVNHYASKDLKLTTMFGIDAIVTEIFIAILCAIFAYIGWTGGLILLFWLCLPACIASLFSAGFTTYEYIQRKKYMKVQQAELKNVQGGSPIKH